uniref:Large ribosomal subunit protein bL32m n=1 Tax=Trichobilharzia regenti TaxID=157069 RepID=A0AA85KQ22_TRIRE|nr:unnamed protein product [Trichobilharzia regenti]
MASIIRALKLAVFNFICREPLICTTNGPLIYPSLTLGPLNHWEDFIYFAVPKKRRTIEVRRIRKHLSLRSGSYDPREDLTPCKFCGHLNPRNFLCTNCYSKVREETNFLRSLLNGQLPSDREIRFVYDSDKSSVGKATTNNVDVNVSGSRPSWFPSTLKPSKPSSSDDGNS